MKNSQIFNRVIFVTRRYDGVHIGEKCFQAVLDAAKSVMTLHSFNMITQKNEYLWTTDKANNSSGVRSKYSQGAQSRGGSNLRGRGNGSRSPREQRAEDNLNNYTQQTYTEVTAVVDYSLPNYGEERVEEKRETDHTVT